MGMFDNVHYNGEVLQTKDFDCEMRDYFIENGRLLKDIGHYVDVPKHERPYPNEPDDSFLSMAGCIRWISEKKEDMNFHGILGTGGFDFKFTDGQLIEAKPN